VHTASSPSSRNAGAVLEKASARFGKTIGAVNGSGNMKDAEGYLASLDITRYRTRPRPPKEKPFVERLIGAFQQECPRCLK
jgi:hypothetical protein